MEIVKFDSKTGWTVAVACAFLSFLVLIPSKVGGLFFVEILDRYQVSRNLAGYPSFTVTLMRCSGGPFAGYLADRFGINEVMILGGVLAGLGISACFFAEDIAAMTVFLGLIHGLGLTCTSTFSPQIVKIHFRKHLTLAFGITQAGACLGAFVSPPMLLWIFRTYGTSGGFLIIGAIVLNALPIVLFLNILSPNKLYNKSSDSMKSEKCQEGHLEMGVTTAVISSQGEYNNTANNAGDVKTRKENGDSEIRNNLENKAVAASVLDKPTYDNMVTVPDRTDGIPLNSSYELTICNLSMKGSGSESGKELVECVPGECGMISNMKPKDTIERKAKVASDEKINELQNDIKEEPILAKLMTSNCEENLLHTKTEYQLKAEIDNKDILKYQVGELKECYPRKDHFSNTHAYTSVNNISASSYLVDQQQITIEKRENILASLDASNVRLTESNESSDQETNQKEVLKVDKELSTEPTSAKKSLRIFLDVTFWVVMITQSIYVFALILFWTTMIDFSRDKKIDRSKEVYLLMVLPIAEIIGRLGLGWITDGKYLTRINFSIISFIGMACSCSLMAWAQEFYVVIASIMAFGIISSGLTTLFPMIVFEFFDLDKHTMGQASRFCLFGPLSFLNGPLIGYFRGTLGSYAWLYHTLAVVLIACGALSTIIPVLARMRDEKKTKNKRS